MKHEQAMQAEALARYQVALYDNYIETLTSLHKECWNPWDWRQVAVAPPPPAPPYLPVRETAARHALQTYQPTLGERMLNRDGVRQQELAAAIESARQFDHAAWQQALAQHRAEHERWSWFHGVARGVLSGELEAYQAVIRHLSPFQELNDLGTQVQLSGSEPWYVEAGLIVRDEEIIPDEAYTLTPTGKLTTKPIAKGRYQEIYQDHVASAAIRIARELFALLPIDFALVHVSSVGVNAATGYQEPFTILSVAFARPTLEALNFDAIDPSTALSNFVHRMKFRKTTGFQTVDRIDPEQFRPALLSAGSSKRGPQDGQAAAGPVSAHSSRSS
jgi:hypothetical protein